MKHIIKILLQEITNILKTNKNRKSQQQNRKSQTRNRRHKKQLNGNLELTSSITEKKEIKISMDGLQNRMESTEQRISELEIKQ